jgi:hypothetical protein
VAARGLGAECGGWGEGAVAYRCAGEVRGWTNRTSAIQRAPG